MIQQAKVLEDDADAPPERGEIILGSNAAASWPKTRTEPRVGRRDSSIKRMRVVLPAPDGPVRN